MSDLDFDRVLINPRERPLSTDFNRLQTELDRSLRDIVMQIFSARWGSGANEQYGNPQAGCIGSGLQVVPVSPLSGTLVRVSPGIGFLVDDTIPYPTDINGINGCDDPSIYKPMYLSDFQNLSFAANPGVGNERWDLIECKPNLRANTDVQSRDVFDAGTQVFVPTAVPKTLTWDLLGQVGAATAANPSTAGLSVKQGAQATVGTAVRPSVTAGYHALAYVYFTHTTSTIDYDVIDDRRLLLAPGGILHGQFACSLDLTTGALTNVRLNLPPGMRATFIGAAPGVLAAAYLYIAIGTQSGTPDTVSAAVNAVIDEQFGFVSDAILACGTSVGNAVVDASLQTQLVGASAYPGMKAAVGQRILQVQLVPRSQHGATTGQNGTYTSDPALIVGSITMRQGS